MRRPLTCARHRATLWAAGFTIAVGCIAACAQAPATAEAPGPKILVDSGIPLTPFAGKWDARATNPAFNGTLILHLELVQRADSVFGTVVMQQREVTTDTPIDIWGVVRDGHQTRLTTRWC